MFSVRAAIADWPGHPVSRVTSLRYNAEEGETIPNTFPELPVIDIDQDAQTVAMLLVLVVVPLAED